MTPTFAKLQKGFSLCIRVDAKMNPQRLLSRDSYIDCMFDSDYYHINAHNGHYLDFAFQGNEQACDKLRRYTTIDNNPATRDRTLNLDRESASSITHLNTQVAQRGNHHSHGAMFKRTLAINGHRLATKSGDTATADREATLQRAKKKSLIARCVAWGLALALLCGALYYFNFVDGRDKTPTPEDTTQSDTTAEGDTGEPLPPRGNEVGNLCVSTELQLYTGGETFAVDNNRGKVTVINFWGTWCGPCIAELPHFEEVAKDYADTVTVVAVHSNYKASTASEWIIKNYPETSILFAQDPDDGANGAYYSALGGVGDFPMTIIVDKDGVITFTCRGSITHEELVDAVEDALAD